ncbi:14828_t:CDS:2 [Cetraspora pellucida]|uniref:14828_t:CDS:1 n=1 Tax=Cetraspora pellucida TaxID=1433469 RepID=A0A9N9E4X3_9GLOM|nr:14828_t:CDS:2 [Cetraspora pellucida]
MSNSVNSMLTLVTSSFVASITCLNNNALTKSYMLFSNKFGLSKNLFLHLSLTCKKTNFG